MPMHNKVTTVDVMKNSPTDRILKLLPAKSPALMKDFAKIFLAKISAGDLSQMEPQAMAATLQTHWDLFQNKRVKK